MCVIAYCHLVVLHLVMNCGDLKVWNECVSSVICHFVVCHYIASLIVWDECICHPLYVIVWLALSCGLVVWDEYICHSVLLIVCLTSRSNWFPTRFWIAHVSRRVKLGRIWFKTIVLKKFRKKIKITYSLK